MDAVNATSPDGSHRSTYCKSVSLSQAELLSVTDERDRLQRGKEVATRTAQESRRMCEAVPFGLAWEIVFSPMPMHLLLRMYKKGSPHHAADPIKEGCVYVRERVGVLVHVYTVDFQRFLGLD